jgi:predicted membrane channel-forming protein YqfA (hemolysin III family)
MTRGLIFWVIMLIMLILAICWHFALLGPYGPASMGVVSYILFVLLGWQVFGPPIRG